MDILKYLKDEIGLSEHTIKNLDGITRDYLLKMEENEINELNIKEEDKKKLINLIKEKNINEIKNEQNLYLNDIEKKLKLNDMIIFEFGSAIITLRLLFEKLEKEQIKIRNK